MKSQTKPRPWFQFSLKFLLVLITVAALLALYWRERTLRIQGEKIIQECGYLEVRNQERLKKAIGGGFRDLSGPRAYTIRTPSAPRDEADFLRPYNHVDILFTMKTDSGGQVASTVLQDVVILAVGSRLHAMKDSSGKISQHRNVTLLVTPDEAAKLALAESVGTLHLTLRNDDDNAFADTNIIYQRDLLKEHPAQ